MLAGTETFTLDFAVDGLSRFAAATAPVANVPAGTTALVENGGTIDAPGGTVLLTAAAAKGVLDNVINTSGIIEATSVANVEARSTFGRGRRHRGERHTRRFGQERGRNRRHG